MLKVRNFNWCECMHFMCVEEYMYMNIFFKFNNEFYQQISGTAMGTKLAPLMLVFS